jgi:hypothetical protein
VNRIVWRSASFVVGAQIGIPITCLRRLTT